MKRIKTIALNVLCLVLALGLLGFFASVGLLVVGLVLFVGLISLVVMRLSDWFGRGDRPARSEKTVA